ncbi:MAG: serine/threonine protein kinase [Gordonia sp.]|uniref:serine/threonine-protein kinase n=1 Tax=Gordonia sp. (in: high G+C Gram-positive bacteria) TaxID=84139 RepID=UPI001D360AEF|nr:serine/threonine-protein kinase [Gordonia sp. (in: high G+C Gram-positive bacteria)]MCB1296211.1 serine/threonine protein kinase [Gordonia sp. (in: high G+C Gram-positive bacteria)]HQV18686.1 serine/threonine-protein kinase [Gordonia sp. (in: high G+C Gram-positive bacteria)]
MLPPGSDFAGYTIVSALGVGGMGQVYLADHPYQHVRVALKLVDDDARVDDADFDERFLSVTGAVAALRHPSVIAVHEYGIEGKIPWCTMDFIDGISLDEEAPTINEIAVISARIAEGLDHAHQHRIVHRDIKPANIMVTRDDLFGAIDRVVILDFGTASITTATTPTTSTAEFMGTIAYTAPEIIRGHSATGRADQYSLAATVYRLITGHTPFAGKSMPALALAVVNEKAPPISSAMPELSALDPVFATALAKEPAHRYPDCQSFARALTRALHSRSLAPPLPRGVPSPEHSASGRSVPPDYHHSALDRRPFAAITDGPDAQDFAGSLRRTVDIPTAPVQTLAPRAAVLPPEVYARRRMTALIGALAVVTVIVVALIAGLRGNDNDTTERHTPATTSLSATSPSGPGVPDP